MIKFNPDWNKAYWIDSKIAIELTKDCEIGFDLAWTEDTSCYFHNYGRRLETIPHKGKCRIHQDSIILYEELCCA